MSNYIRGSVVVFAGIFYVVCYLAPSTAAVYLTVGLKLHLVELPM